MADCRHVPRRFSRQSNVPGFSGEAERQRGFRPLQAVVGRRPGRLSRRSGVPALIRSSSGRELGGAHHSLLQATLRPSLDLVRLRA